MCIILKNRANDYVFKSLHTIDEISHCIKEYKVPIDRSKIKLYVLDDEGFNNDALSKLGYKDVTKYTKFEHIEDFDQADIILCDVDGIGGDLDPKQQGLAVAENIKKLHPQKIVLIYTSKNIESYGKYPDILDGMLRKQMTMSELAQELDAIYEKSKDVVNIWIHTRQSMLDDNVPTKVIAFAESIYCDSLLKKKDMFEDSEIQDFIKAQSIMKYLSFAIDIIKVVIALSV